MREEKRLLIKKNRTKEIRRRLITIFAIFVFSSFIILFVSGLSVKAESKERVELYKYYKSECVMKDDTLWSFAKKYAPDNNYRKYIDEVKNTNHLENDELIEGMYIILPYYSSDIF